jgi:thymidine kinase
MKRAAIVIHYKKNLNMIYASFHNDVRKNEYQSSLKSIIFTKNDSDNFNNTKNFLKELMKLSRQLNTNFIIDDAAQLKINRIYNTKLKNKDK